VLLGAAQAGTTYAVVYGVIGRRSIPAKRSWAMGVAAAAGSFGQFLMVPVEGFLISSSWAGRQALLALSLPGHAADQSRWPSACASPAFRAAGAGVSSPSCRRCARPFKYPSFQLLMAGYFVCGFQVVFIGVHMPSYLKDKGLSPQVASYALALIGLFNVFGTYIAGSLGQRMAKRKILAFIYWRGPWRSPCSWWCRCRRCRLCLCQRDGPAVAVHRAAHQRHVAQIFGVAHLSMLGGFVFFSHQIGSFMGVWLGGYLYDRTGSYDMSGTSPLRWACSRRWSTCRSRRPRSSVLPWRQVHDHEPLRPVRLQRLLAYAGAAAVLLGVFALYTAPDFMVTLAQQLWACF
jgi:predicted MFS family arabinose efflux permease